jgi:hypothetical protein
VIQVIVVAECGSELSQIWTASNGIPNPDLEGSGELRALCSTRRSGSGTRGCSSLARRLYPKVGPVIVRAADVPRLRPKVFGREDSCPSQGYQSAYCIG